MSDRYEREVGESLLGLAADVDEFTRHRVPQPLDAPARKCAAEAAEFAAAPSLDEAADVLITLLGWVTSNDYPISAWLDAAHRKMETNLRRTWVQQPDGTWQHVDKLVRLSRMHSHSAGRPGPPPRQRPSTTPGRTEHVTTLLTETIRCDSACHDVHDDDCPECASGDWSRMCDDCRYYAAQDGPET